MFGRATIRLGIGPHSSFICKIDGEFFNFKQDSAQVHRACETINLRQMFTDFNKCSAVAEIGDCLATIDMG